MDGVPGLLSGNPNLEMLLNWGSWSSADNGEEVLAAIGDESFEPEPLRVAGAILTLCVPQTCKLPNEEVNS